MVVTDPVEPAIRWWDQHCHLPDDDLDGYVGRAAAAGVLRLIDVGCDVAGSTQAIERAHRFEGVSATAGVHPHDAAGGIVGLEELLADPEVVAVGECGLDYHYEHSPRQAQREVFAQQIDLALRYELPLVIHTRSAWDDTFDVLAEVGVPARTVFHCFTGGPDEAARCLDIGASLSFSGIVTFPSAADDVAKVAATCPMDRLLVETDSPYLSPVPLRGRPNHPSNVAVVGAFVAALRSEAVEHVADRTWRNAEAFYRRDA